MTIEHILDMHPTDGKPDRNNVIWHFDVMGLFYCWYGEPQEDIAPRWMGKLTMYIPDPIYEIGWDDSELPLGPMMIEQVMIAYQSLTGFTKHFRFDGLHSVYQWQNVAPNSMEAGYFAFTA